MDPTALRKWASDIGPDTHLWVDTQLKSRPHPEQAYKVCLGLLNLSLDYPSCRLNRACLLANREGLTRLKNIKSILKSNRDQLQQELALSVELPQSHDNIRGPENFR